MKFFLRLCVFFLAIAMMAGAYLNWKHNDSKEAERSIREDYKAVISKKDGEVAVGCDSEKLTDLQEFAALLNRFCEVTSLDLTGSPELQSLKGAEQFAKLRSIVAIDCPKLTSVAGVGAHPELYEIILTDSVNVSDFSELRDLPALSIIDVSGCRAMQTLDLTTLPALKNLYTSRCRNLAALDVTQNPLLEQLFADGCAKLKTVEGLGGLKELTDLDLSNCDSISEISGIGSLDKLVVLDLRNVELLNFAEIGQMKELEVLRMGGQTNLEDLTAFTEMTALQEFHLEACPNLKSIEGMPPNLSNYLAITYCPQLKSLSGLSAAPKLEFVDVSGCETLSDIDDLQSLDHLVQLNLSKCPMITKLDALKDRAKLAFVLLGGSGVSPDSIKEIKREMRHTSFDFLIADQQ